MFVLSQSGVAGLDAMGYDINVQERQLQDGSTVRVFMIIGFGFGFNLLLGEYTIEEQARAVLTDIYVAMRNGEEFYDIREKEKKFINRQS